MTLFFHKDGAPHSSFQPKTGRSGDTAVLFVFGSNCHGDHAGGAAAYAHQQLGYPAGKAVGYSYFRPSFRPSTPLSSGLSGSAAYGIPTMDRPGGAPLPLTVIKDFVEQFIRWNIGNNWWCPMFVTRIGCGIAGYQDSDIAPLFKFLALRANRKRSVRVSFAEDWLPYLA